MAKGTKFNDDLLEKLRDSKFASEYISAALEEGSEIYLIKALNNVVKAHGPSKIAKATHLSRQAIYKMFSPKGNPTLQSVYSVLEALGLKITIEPKRKRSA